MSRIKQFCSQNKREIVLTIGVFLIAVVSFQIGLLWKINAKQGNNVAISEFGSMQANLGAVTTDLAGDNVDAPIPAAVPAEKLFIASKNSKKYHKISCSWANRINEENKIYFSSREETEKLGFEAASCCVDD